MTAIWNHLTRISDKFWSPLITVIQETGAVVLLALQALFWLFKPPLRLRNFIRAMEFVGVGSIGIVALVASFTGAAFSLQTVYTFRMFQADAYIGVTVALTLSRELAPVLTALMVTARAGSAMATELGSMRITEQIDALYTMAVSPVQFLVTPRIVAGVVMMPLLTMVFNLVGIFGAYFVACGLMGVDQGPFWHYTLYYIDPRDIMEGLIKSVVFGFVFSAISCYQGFYAGGGAAGVGRATTRAVVWSSVLILFFDVVVTDILLTVLG